METSVRDLIRLALLKIGAISPNDAPTDTESRDALMSLNQMLGNWSNDSVTAVSRKWETFDLVSGQKIYTIGKTDESVDFNCKPCCEPLPEPIDPDAPIPEPVITTHFETVRPVQIITSYVKLNNVDYNLKIVSDESYNQSIGIKNLEGIPQFLSYDNAYPLGHIRLFPVPANNYKLFLLSEKPIGNFSSPDDLIKLPPGWEEAIVYNLAIRLAPDYAQEPRQDVVMIAKESLGAIRRSIVKNRKLDWGFRGGRGNIYDGWSV